MARHRMQQPLLPILLLYGTRKNYTIINSFFYMIFLTDIISTRTIQIYKKNMLLGQTFCSYMEQAKFIRQLTVLFFYDYLNSSYFHKDNTNIQENMLLGQNNVVYIWDTRHEQQICFVTFLL